VNLVSLCIELAWDASLRLVSARRSANVHLPAKSGLPTRCGRDLSSLFEMLGNCSGWYTTAAPEHRCAQVQSQPGESGERRPRKEAQTNRRPLFAARTDDESQKSLFPVLATGTSARRDARCARSVALCGVNDVHLLCLATICARYVGLRSLPYMLGRLLPCLRTALCCSFPLQSFGCAVATQALAQQNRSRCYSSTVSAKHSRLLHDFSDGARASMWGRVWDWACCLPSRRDVPL
jgi:hypothetical protein